MRALNSKPGETHAFLSLHRRPYGVLNTTLGVSQMVDHFPEALSAKSMSGCNVMPWSETQDLTVRQVTNSSKRIRLTL